MNRRGVLAFTILSLLAAQPAWALTHLVILHTNDTHNHMLPFDTKRAKDVGGIARRATLVQELRGKEKALLFDAGDIFQGTPNYTFFKGEADYKVLEQIGYDAVAIGNHDLDDGWDNLSKQSGKRIPILNSNLLLNGKPMVAASKVFTVDGVKLGVFGLIGEDAFGTITRKNRKGITCKSPVDTAREMVAALKKEADLVVCLSHSGYKEDKDLAQAVPGIDLIVGGHSHTTLDRVEKCGKTYLVQAGQWGEYVGRLDLEVEGKEILQARETLLPVDGKIKPDPRVAALVDSYETRIRAKMGEVVGHARTSLQTGRNSQSELGSWATDMMRSLTGADLAILNSGGIRAPFPAGDITVGDVFTTFPFDNQLVTLDMPGTLLQEIMDDNAANYGERGVPIQVSGLSWKIQGGKAELSIQGEPIDPAKIYSVATIDYLAQGSDHQRGLAKASAMHNTGKWVRDAVIDYLRRHPEVVAPQDARFGGVQ